MLADSRRYWSPDARPEALPGQARVYYCTASLGRPEQHLTALLVNYIVHYRFRGSVVFITCTFGRDIFWWKNISALFGYVDHQMLEFFSGGTAGMQALMLLRRTSTPEELETWQVKSAGPLSLVLSTWHASHAKNASHLAAIASITAGGHTLEGSILCNLDADNICPAAFSVSLATALPEALPGRVVCAGAATGVGTTGRIAMAATTFLEVGGYDEDLLPMGYQDIDIRNRISNGIGINRSPYKRIQYVNGVHLVGGAIPNDSSDRKKDRGSAKICNIADQFKSKKLSWAQMNMKNRDVCRDRSQGRLQRNDGRPKGAWLCWLDNWWMSDAPLLDIVPEALPGTFFDEPHLWLERDRPYHWELPPLVRIHNTPSVRGSTRAESERSRSPRGSRAGDPPTTAAADPAHRATPANQPRRCVLTARYRAEALPAPPAPKCYFQLVTGGLACFHHLMEPTNAQCLPAQHICA